MFGKVISLRKKTTMKDSQKLFLYLSSIISISTAGMTQAASPDYKKIWFLCLIGYCISWVLFFVSLRLSYEKPSNLIIGIMVFCLLLFVEMTLRVWLGFSVF
jgi:hypothetical protein